MPNFYGILLKVYEHLLQLQLKRKIKREKRKNSA